MHCLSCDYDLSHLAEHRCPECGREFDPNDPRIKHPRRRYWLRVVRYTVVGEVLLSVALFAIFFFDGWLNPPPHGLPYPGTSAIGIGTTAVMIGDVLFFPFVAIGAMLIARRRR